MDKRSKRVQVGLCQYMEPLGWATCQRLSPNPDVLFYKISNDVPVHRLFLDQRFGEKSMPTHPVSSVWHASSRYTDIDKSSLSQVIFFFEKSRKPSNPHPSVWHASSRYTDINKSSISQVIFFFEKSHKPSSPASFLPPGPYGLFSCIRITRLGFSSQSTMCWLIRAESSLALEKVFFFF